MDLFEIIRFEDINNDILTDNLFSSKKWVEVLVRTYEFEIQYFLIRRPITVIIPFAIVYNLKGSRVISLPFCDYINTQKVGYDDYLLFVEYLKNKYPKIPIDLKTTYDESFCIGKVIRKAFYHTIDLSREIKYSSAFQRGVNKAKSSDLIIAHENTLVGLAKFYNLYGNLRIKKFKSIPQPFSFFKNIFNIFIEQGFGEIITASIDNQVVAAIIVLKSNNVLYYKFGASDTENLLFRPNNLIFDYLIQYSKQHGFCMIDLGLSGASDNYAGLRRFKESMGGKKVGITYFRINPVVYDDSYEKRVSTIMEELTKEIIFAKLDLFNVEKISNLIYKNFA